MITAEVRDNKIIVEIPDDFFDTLADNETISLKITNKNRMISWLKSGKMFYDAYANGESWIEGIVSHNFDE